MKGEKQPLENIGIKDMVTRIDALRRQGFRILQICCTALPGNKFELTYSFDKDYNYTSFRITVDRKEIVPSITGTYAGAFLYENEIKELFGIGFSGINVDYNGHLYKKRIKAPFSEGKEETVCQKG